MAGLDGINGMDGIVPCLKGHPPFSTMPPIALIREGIVVAAPPMVRATEDRATAPAAVAQLDELRRLRDGWLDGDGIAPSGAGLDWLSERLTQRYPPAAPVPYIYPTPDGGIPAEWTLGRREISLCIDLSTPAAAWFSVDLNTDAVSERALSLDDAAAWAWLGSELRRIAGAGQ